MNPEAELHKAAQSISCDVFSRQFAVSMDENDPLKSFRERFVIPKNRTIASDPELVDLDEDCIYFGGHTLGLSPKNSKKYVDEVFQNWGELGFKMHYRRRLAASTCDDMLKPYLSELTGAEEEEVCAMNGLSVNLNCVIMTFYKPTETRHKILIEANAFSSDRYAVQSLLEFHGYDPSESLIEIAPKQGEHCLKEDDIISCIEQNGGQIAMILFCTVQYYTGQVLNMKRITEVGHKHGCIVGFDLAHAIGNIKLKLHEWNVDFAVWCSYKYLSGGPGGLGGVFIHRHNFHVKPAMVGWWGNKYETRFKNEQNMDLSIGADGYKGTCVSPFLAVMVYAGLENFHDAGMDRILQKQFLLTGYLEMLLEHHFGSRNTDDLSTFNHLSKESSSIKPLIRIITPKDVNQRGSQISLLFGVPAAEIEEKLTKCGIIVDVKVPSTFKIGPIPLYNTFKDVYNFVEKLNIILI